jgi:aldehyde oxidoreductase
LVDAVIAAAKVLRGEATIEDISFKDPEDNEYYGKPVVRPTALAKVCGLADYGDDQELKMPAESLHVAIVQPKIAHHAKILSIDISKAEKMPGLVKIILAKDIVEAGGTNIMAEAQFHERTTVMVPSRKILCDEKLFRYGDVVALAVADTKDHARAAAKEVKVEIEKLPEYLNYLDAVVPDAMRIHEDTPNIFSQQPLLKGVGLDDPYKVQDVLDNSMHCVSGSFHSTREPHLSIEGTTVQAYFDDNDDLTIQCKSQGVYSTIGRIGNSLGLSKDKIRIVMNPTGASFGWSTNAGDVCLAGAAAAFFRKKKSFLLKRYPCL